MANPKHLQILQRLLCSIMLACACGFVSWLMPSIPGYVILLVYALGCMMVARAGRVIGLLLLAYGGIALCFVLHIWLFTWAYSGVPMTRVPYPISAMILLFYVVSCLAATSTLAKPPPRHSEASRGGTMTRTDARQLADTIAKDLARLAPLTTRYAVLCRVSVDMYHVAARMGGEYVLFDSPEAWAKHVEAWERAQREAAVRARRPDHWVLRAVGMVLALGGALVGFAWLYASSPLVRWICWVVFTD